MTQEALEKAFVQAMQRVLSQKDAVLTACREALDEAFDTTELDKAATRLQDQALGMAERVRQMVEENARAKGIRTSSRRIMRHCSPNTQGSVRKFRRLPSRKKIRQNVGGASSYSSTCWKNRKSA